MKSKMFWPILFRLKNKIRNGFWFLFLWSRIAVQNQLHYNIQIRAWIEILKKWKMNEIKKKKNGKYFRSSVPTLLDDDDLIKKVF